ncbi:MAG: dihydroneopterin aldolase [Bacteroidota bacterium]
MGEVKVNNIRVYAHHGCLKEETAIGSEYRVDISVIADLSGPSRSDKLSETVDYVHIHNIVTAEMKIPSKLLEHVGQRILERILRELVLAQEATVAVSKINPPIGGDVEKVTVILTEKRSG